MMFGPGSARFITRSVTAMLVPKRQDRRGPMTLPTIALDATGRRRTPLNAPMHLKGSTKSDVLGHLRT